MVELKIKDLKRYGWDEVKKHNHRADCWVVVERVVDGVKKGIILDITQWAPRHPGGSIIYDGAGGDCTVMFWCYHPLSFIDNCNSYINKYAVGEIENYECVYDVGSQFFRTLKRRMEEKIPRADRCRDWRLWFKTFLILLTVAVTFYTGWIKGNIPSIVVLAVFMAQMSINIMHDGIHTSYSKHSWVCSVASFCMNLTGSNFLAYRRVHAFGHHAYTSHDEYDSSIPRSFPLVKLHDRLPKFWYHAFQHVYIWLVFAFSAVHFWFGDFGEMASFWNYPRRKGDITLHQWAYVILGKILFFSWFFGISFSLFPWKTALFHCILLELVEGSTSVIFFAVNHWTDKAVLVNKDEMIKHTKDWATLQVITSTNFSINSWFWTHFSGGLNLQIEHHLFPQLVHTRLHDVTPIVKQTLAEYGLDYDDQCYSSFTASVLGMVSFLRRVGVVEPLKPFPNVGDPAPLTDTKKTA
jgi:acyl-lipid (8-3)-desaturase